MAVLAGLRLLALLGFWSGGVSAYSEARQECVLGGDEDCSESDTSFFQLNREGHRTGSCAGEIHQRVAQHVKLADSHAPDEGSILAAFRNGCDPTSSLYSKDCPAVKRAHAIAYFHMLERLNEEIQKVGSLSVSFDDFAMLTLFNCMWHSRHNPGDNFGDKPFDTCTEEELCGMITTRHDFERQLPQVSLEATQKLGAFGAASQRRKTQPGWPGTNKTHQMVRVSLLHKSDGTSSASETILGRSGLRLSVINGGWAQPATLRLEPKYSEGFQIAWGQIRSGMLPKKKIGGQPLHLQSGLAAAEPGQVIRNFSDAPVAAKMPPPAGSPITLVVIGDPCNGNMLGAGQCNFRDYYGVNRTLPMLLNAALPSSDVWYLTGDNFYDRYGIFTVGIFAQLEAAAQGIPVLSTPGNHDYWFDGIPGLAFDDFVFGYDQFANGGAQFYAMDSAAAFAPAAPQESLISPQGADALRFSEAPAFLDLSAAPSKDAQPSNFQHYSIAGNVGFIMITCVGGDPRPFVSEACTFMKQKNPELVLILGHWNKPGSGCTTGWDVPSVTSWALDHSDCAAFRGQSGKPPYGPAKAAATRLKFIVGHQHCNCMTNFAVTVKDYCLNDTADPSEVDGFIIGSHGMSWDVQSAPKCSARFGLPVLRTNGNTLSFAYAKLSLDTTLTHCAWWDVFCHLGPGEVSRTNLLEAFLGHTPSAWSAAKVGPYGKGIIQEKMDGLLACLKEKGTQECSKDAKLFDQWYSKALQ